MDLSVVLENLGKRKFIPHLCKNINDARAVVLSLIATGETVSFGGSMTIEDGKIPQCLRDEGRLAYHYLLYSAEEFRQLPKATDWFMSSINAMTEGGELVNIDGRCSREIGLIGGVQNVCVIVGVNKLVPSLDNAVARIKKFACPPNARRLGRDLPCAIDACPGECQCAQKMCTTTVIHHNPPIGKNFHVIVVEENLGY